MPQDTTITLAQRQWTQLTNADVAGLAFQHLGQNPVSIMATGGPQPANQPGTSNSARILRPGEHFPDTVLLADLWPGIASAVRLWAWAESAGEKIAVSHA